MTEDKPRIQKVLAYLYDAEELVRPKDIADTLGESPLNVGKDLHSLKERGLAVSKGEGQWEITDEGREWLESGGGKEMGRKEERKEITPETVPSQSDLFRSIGEKLGVGARKGDVRLDVVAYYVQRTADLDKLTSVWNALTEMGIANDVKKRWIKLYAQTIPGQEIPEELKEKLEMVEPDRIKSDEIPPKPKRFSVVGGEIIGDPEGDYNFKEALQYVAQQRGASPDEAGSIALALSKMGPDMLSTVLGAMTPLLKKESPQSETTLSTIQALRELGFGKPDEGLKTELGNIRKEMTDMREERHREQIINQQQQIRHSLAKSGI